jgi:hypothetical protein
MDYKYIGRKKYESGLRLSSQLISFFFFIQALLENNIKK